MMVAVETCGSCDGKGEVTCGTRHDWWVDTCPDCDGDKVVPVFPYEPTNPEGTTNV